MKDPDPKFNLMNYFAEEGEKGMTLTSANKLANLATERNREDMLFVESVRFYDDVMTLLVNPGEPVTLSKGLSGDEDTFVKIREALLRIARFNAFIAWVREAIWAKKTMISMVGLPTLEEWCKKRGIDFPEDPENDVETKLKELRSAGKASIDEMARYFINQSKASVLGQAIHYDGVLERARCDLIEANHSPSKTEGVGKDTVIKTRQPTAKTDAVTDFYMSLQSEWRHAESAVNEAKGKYKTEDAELRIELTNEYNARVREYENKIKHIKEQWDLWKLEETRRLGKLKIRIPSALQPVLDELLALGK